MPTVSQQRTLLLLYSNTALTFHLTSANTLPTTHAPLALQQHDPNFSSYKCQQSPNNCTLLSLCSKHGPNFSSYKCQQSPNNCTLLSLYSNTALTFHLTSANSLPTTHAPLALQQHGHNFSSYKCQQSPNNARSSCSTATRP